MSGIRDMHADAGSDAAIQSKDLCRGCKSFDFGSILWSGDIGWEGAKLDTSRHPGFRSLDHLAQSAPNCRCCSFMYSNLEDRAQKNLQTHRILMTQIEWKDIRDLPLYIEAACFNTSVMVRYGTEDVLRDDGRVDGNRSVTASSTLRHDSTERLPWLDRKDPPWDKAEKVTYVEDRTKSISADPRAAGVIKQISTWLHICCGHEDCNPRKSLTPPDRLIDAGTLASPRMRLVLASKADLRGSRYIALSYCWGTQNQFMTTRERFEEFQTHIDEDIMPQTFKDVVYLSRQLGIQYVWIDAICIMQGDRQDWEEQSAQMAKIYEGSYVTICASNASIVHHGFLVSPRSPALVNCGNIVLPNGGEANAYMSNEPTHIHGALESVIAQEPLSDRGWALQERILPYRCIFFGTRQIIWQCRSMMTTETAVTVQPPTSLLASPAQHQDHVRIHQQWRLLLQSFSKCALTRPSDRLPAISGLASVYGEILQNDPYIAGHWLSDLPRSMLWQVLKEATPVKHYRAPSWSWASLESEIEFLADTASIKLIASVIDSNVRLRSSNIYGEVEDVLLTLSAPIYRANVDPERLYQSQTISQLSFLTTEDGTKSTTNNEERGNEVTWSRFYIELDRRSNIKVEADGRLQVHFVAIGSRNSGCCGIVVVPVVDHTDLYNRVGIFEDMELPPDHKFSRLDIQLM